MKITYYTNSKIEILVIKDGNGNIIKKGLYTIGNCLVDILFDKAIVCDDSVLDIELKTKMGIMRLLEQCSDYLHNDIQKIIEKDFAFIFDQKYLFQNIFIENKLCKVYMMNNFYTFICLLVTHIYTQNIMYKRCKYCNSLFATKYTKAKYCKRTATVNGKTCGYASSLKQKKNAK